MALNPPADPVLEITGPISLFRHTRRYGHALASFLPACTLGRTYRIEASIVLSSRRFPLVITEADDVLSPHREPRAFDSRAEERLHQDFTALGSRWDIVREGDLIPVGSTVFIPDFTFRLRDAPTVRVHLEIVGFWTRDYLVRKQALVRALGPENIVICLDEKLCCDRGAWTFPCIPYSGRIDAGRVLEALERIAGGFSGHGPPAAG